VELSENESPLFSLIAATGMTERSYGKNYDEKTPLSCDLLRIILYSFCSLHGKQIAKKKYNNIAFSILII